MNNKNRVYSQSTGNRAAKIGLVTEALRIFRHHRHEIRCIKQQDGRILIRHGKGLKHSSWVDVNSFKSVKYYVPPGAKKNGNFMDLGDYEYQQQQKRLAEGDLTPTGDLKFGPPTCDCKKWGHSCRFSNTSFSRYGTRPRRIKTRKGRSSLHHKGCDIGGPSGAPVVSVEQGRIIFAGRNGGYGNAVHVEHRDTKGNVYVSQYNHLKKITVSVGQIVAKSEQIGSIGSTGVSTGPHLHVEIHHMTGPTKPIFGKTVDPAKYIKLTSENLSQTCNGLRAKNRTLRGSEYDIRSGR